MTKQEHLIPRRTAVIVAVLTLLAAVAAGVIAAHDAGLPEQTGSAR